LPPHGFGIHGEFTLRMIKFCMRRTGRNQMIACKTSAIKTPENSRNFSFFLVQDEPLTNITRSVLNFVPTTEDDGKSITCRAENPKVSGLFKEKSWTIEVICKLPLDDVSGEFTGNLLPLETLRSHSAAVIAINRARLVSFPT
jgi:hypothetical protein